MVDLVGWSPQDWDNVREAARKGYDSAAQVRSVIPIGPKPTDPYFVAVPDIGPNAKDSVLEARSVKGIPPIRLKHPFRVKSDQLGDLPLVCQLARRAGQAIGGVESTVLSIGGVGTVNGVTIEGTVASLRDAANNVGSSADVFDLIRDGITALNGNGHYGSFALVMGPVLWAAYHKVEGTRSGSAKLASLLGEEGRIAMAPGAADAGFLIAIGSFALDIVQFDDLSVGLLEVTGGNVVLQVEERFLLRKMDPTAIVELTYSAAVRAPAPAATKNAASDDRKKGGT